MADTAWSPRRSLREGTAHCYEGALLAAAALRVNGYPPLVVDLEAVRDVDHVIAVFRERGHWGAVAKSNFAGLRFRAPIYRTLRELALSYFESYYNLRGERTLRGYSRPVNLARFDHLDWMTSEKSVWAIAEHLVTVSHAAAVPCPPGEKPAPPRPPLLRRRADRIQEALRLPSFNFTAVSERRSVSEQFSMFLCMRGRFWLDSLAPQFLQNPTPPDFSRVEPA